MNKHLKRVTDWETEIEYSIFREGKLIERKTTPLWQHYLNIKHKEPQTLSEMFRKFTYNGWSYVLHSEDLDLLWLRKNFMDEGADLWNALRWRNYLKKS